MPMVVENASSKLIATVTSALTPVPLKSGLGGAIDLISALHRINSSLSSTQASYRPSIYSALL